MKRRIIIFIDNIDILSRFFISDYVKRRQKSILTRIFSYKMKMILKKARQIVFYSLFVSKATSDDRYNYYLLLHFVKNGELQTQTVKLSCLISLIDNTVNKTAP